MRGTAVLVLRIGSWLSLAGGVIGCALLLFASQPEPIDYGIDEPTPQPRPADPMAKWYALGILLTGTMAWALGLTMAHVADESEALKRALEGGE